MHTRSGSCLLLMFALDKEEHPHSKVLLQHSISHWRVMHMLRHRGLSTPVKLGLEWRVDGSGQQDRTGSSFLGSKLGSLLHKGVRSVQHACHQHEHPSVLVSPCRACA